MVILKKMNKVMQLTAIKQHLGGDYFEPVNVAPEIFYLCNSLAILVGVNGNEFEFKNEENAIKWIDANILQVGKQRQSDLANLLGLQQRNAVQVQDWLTVEIQTILDRDAGLWGDVDTFYDGGNAVN